ncbi:cell adhesion molecule Dscam2-like isoform X2 [Ornithodoros turicata]|uniref:cell adhesion molecule Dscam2-like isoform X2 n=1 Tax=Ornithodoros turicata TaxID=34597 RepID=UPI00313923EE
MAGVVLTGAVMCSAVLCVLRRSVPKCCFGSVAHLRRTSGGSSAWTGCLAVLSLFQVLGQAATSSDVWETRRAPSFTLEPPHWVEFSNTSGAEVRCEADGLPPPQVVWVTVDGGAVVVSPGLRLLEDGGSTLVFPAFPADAYRQDVHAALYRCMATNVMGTIASRDVHVTAVVDYQYEPRVHDGFVIRGNTAILKCHVPSYIRQYTLVDAWIRDDGFTINASGNKEDRYTLLQTGELLVYKTAPEDAIRSYRCRTRHRLTGHLTASSVAGKVTVTEAHAATQVKVTLSLSEVKAKIGGHADLPCVAQGYPPPHYTWYKEDRGRRVSVVESDRMQTSNGVLSIRAVTVQDGGRYICVARNSAGEQKVETLLSVAVPLSATLEPAFQTIAVGLPVTLNCSVQGQPVHRVTWWKDGVLLVPDGRVQLISRDQIRIKSVRREDAGMYQCVAQNERDSCQAAAHLRLDDISPVLDETFEPSVIRRGEPISLSCRARGSPVPDVTWTLDGDLLYPSHRVKITSERTTTEIASVLNISEARLEDSGEYSCVARNDIATVTHSARLDVHGPPFVRPLRNVTVVSATELRLRCPYGGHPVDAVTWHKGGMVLPVNYRQGVDSRGGLVIQEAQKPADEGEYTCFVTGSSGLTASGSTYVSVVVAPMIDDHFFPDVIKVEEGTRSRLMCSVSKGDPPLRFRWIKNGLNINTRGDRTIEANDDSSIIKFARVRFSDKGRYVCFVSNDAASVNRTVELVVHVSPRWKTEPQNASVILGGSVFLHCASDGYPTPSITWKKGQGSAPRNFTYVHYNFRNHHFLNGSLLIREVEESDRGYYLCEAHNGIGSGISKLIFLNVHVPPRFEVKHRSFLVKKGEDFSAHCRAHGEAPMAYHWEKNQKPVDGERHQTKDGEDKNGDVQSLLQILETVREDSAVYSCKARNNYGEDSTHLQLIVQEPPDAPSSLTVTNYTSRSATIQWQAPYNGNSQISRYVLQHKLQKESWSGPVSQMVIPGTDVTATVRGLQPVTKYALRIVAENALGPGAPSNASLVTTMEEAPTGTPSSVTVHTTGSQSLKVSWRPPSKEHQHGTIVGYQVGYRVAHTDDSFQFKQVEVRPGGDSNNQETTYLTNLQRLTKYGIVVQAYNRAGTGPASDEVIATTLETAPPTSPSIKAVALSSSSLSVHWERDSKDKSLVTEYVLHYGTDNGEWKKMPLNASRQTFVLEGLNCGSVYRLYMTASNSLGTGEPGDEVTVRTKGAAPISPMVDKFITTNATSAILHLGSWSTGGCPVTHFSIQYRLKFHPTWLPMAETVSPRSRSYVLNDLLPDRQYQVSVIAHSEAGQTQADFEFHTPALSAAATLIPTAIQDQSSVPLHQNVAVVAPVAVSAAIVLVSLLAVYVCLRRRGSHYDSHNANGGHPRKLYLDGAMIMSEFSQKAATVNSTAQRSSYYASPAKKPQAVTASSNHKPTKDRTYAEPYPSSGEQPAYGSRSTTQQPKARGKDDYGGNGTPLSIALSSCPLTKSSFTNVRASVCSSDGRISHSVLPQDKYLSGEGYGSISSQSGESTGDRCSQSGSLPRTHLRHFEFVS